MGKFLVDLGVLALVPLLSAGLGLVLKRLSIQRRAVACGGADCGLLVLHGRFVSNDVSWLLSHRVPGDASAVDLLISPTCTFYCSCGVLGLARFLY